MTNGIDVIWCDFGGVLTPPLEQATIAIERASGVSWPMLWEGAAYVAAEFGLTGLGPLELGLLSQREWGARVTAALPRGVVPHVDLGLFGDFWYADRQLEWPLVAELERCADTGMRIGLLTNSVLEWEPHRARMLSGVSVFEQVVRSHELGIGKPDPRIFQHADRILPPVRGSLLIDDVPQNTAAATAHGWHGLTHISATETIAALSRLRS